MDYARCMPELQIELADHPCGSCLQTYDLALEVWCVACDRPVCPVCIVVVHGTGERFCPECGEAA